MREPGSDHPITIAKNPHRIRVVLGGFIIAESTEVLTVREASLPPVHYIPRKDVRMDLLEPTDHRTNSPTKGEACHFTVTGGGLVRENAAWSYEKPHPSAGQIAGYVAFSPSKVDAIEEFKD